MKTLTKPMKFQTVSSHIYGYEGGGGTHLEWFYTDENNCQYYDCVADPGTGQACSSLDCWVLWCPWHTSGPEEICP